MTPSDIEAEFPPEMSLEGAEEIPVTEGPGGVPATEDGTAATSRNGPSVRERASRNGFVDDEHAPAPRVHVATGPAGTGPDQIELELRSRLTELEHWQKRIATIFLLLAAGGLAIGALIWMLSRDESPVVTP